MDQKTAGDIEAIQTASRGDGQIDEKPDLNPDILSEQYGRTQRGLSPRHVQLMAIGGSIGVGLWVGIGSVLSRAGPLSLLLGYTFWGVFFIWPYVQLVIVIESVSNMPPVAISASQKCAPGFLSAAPSSSWLLDLLTPLLDVSPPSVFI